MPDVRDGDFDYWDTAPVDGPHEVQDLDPDQWSDVGWVDAEKAFAGFRRRCVSSWAWPWNQVNLDYNWAPLPPSPEVVERVRKILEEES